MNGFHLESHGIQVKKILRNASPAELYEEAIRHESDTRLSSAGALMAYSGSKTGRSPKDKRVVRNPAFEEEVWWGSVNVPLDETAFLINRERALDYLNTRQCIYCTDGYAGWDSKHRLKVRVIASRPYHALFMWNMLIRPSAEELADFGEPDVTIFNAGTFPANRHTSGMTSKTSVDLSLEDREVVILGTEYAGEMKKAVFSYMNYAMPKRGVLSMHCSATAEPADERCSILFGLSGTGKTTLSADPKRRLVGDDEHCWTDDGIFNIEGGCYAKAIHLTREAEPQIYDALGFGAVLENVIYNEATRQVNYHDDSITENTRGAYAIDSIPNAKLPCIAGHPSDVIFLTCDAFGVLPPLSRLTPDQAEYHFISGYTAKVAGTEVGITEPQATFSPCFGGPFLVWHPGKYAQMLSERIRRHGSQVWLVNTGWSGGAYGTGSRIKLKYTRAMLDAIYAGALRNARTVMDPTFGLEVIAECPGAPSEAMLPRDSWEDKAAYDQTAAKLAGLFRKNFKAYESGVSQSVREAGPR